MKPFRAPHDAIGALDAVSAATLAASAADLALVLDRDGLIQDLAVQPSDLAGEIEGYGRWLGRPWSDTVPAESRPKVQKLLDEATRDRVSSWRQLTHKAVGGREVSILYAALKIGADGRTVVLGRDMRAVSALQQRLIDAQMSMERDYARLRSAETRYRLLFHASAEPVLILDGGSAKVLELNPAAAALLETGTRRIVGRPFTELVAADTRTRLQQHFAELRAGRTGEIEVTFAGVGRMVLLATPFRQDALGLLLVRLAKPAALPSPEVSAQLPDANRLADFIQASPDAVVVADAGGRVIAANPAFAEMAQAGDVAALRGEALDTWFGRPGVDFDLAMMNLRQHGSLRLFATDLRGSQGGRIVVEASAVELGQGKDAAYGFAIRDVGRRMEAPSRPVPDLPHSAEQLAELIGRVPLKDLVRETTDVIEKLCIEAALDLTNDNRASAAEVLGLSRQSLYVKLRRFGLAEASGEADV